MTTLTSFLKRFIEPSPKITEPDERRQASLLSSLLLGIIVLAALLEAVTVSLLEWQHYTGYRQTIVTVCLLAIIYAISRTEHIRLATMLTVIIISLAVYLSGLAQPDGVLGGFLDFLILPLWLASIYLRMRSLIILTAIKMLALLAFPWLSSQCDVERNPDRPLQFHLCSLDPADHPDPASQPTSNRTAGRN